MNTDENCNDLQEIITQALNKIKSEQGKNFSLQKVNLAEMNRLTGLSRSKLRHLKDNDFEVKPHGSSGKKAKKTVLTGYTGTIDNLLKSGVTNSRVCLEKIQAVGYTGSQTVVKDYIREHKDLLVPAKRIMVDPQGNRGRRYTTGPGEVYQMDWGFVNVTPEDGGEPYRVACFAMICHHCGRFYVEFFPNAKQENLFIGMIHGFAQLGVPEYILTDNMKSVVIRRDSQGHPIWQHDYESFMQAIGFQTKLCKPRHPFTKGKVERLIRFVKENFLAGRAIANITELNIEAIRWSNRHGNQYHKATDCIPAQRHAESCLSVATILEETKDLAFYLCPERRISYDGFVTFEGRRFGVPYWYTKKVCRVRRHMFTVYIYSDDLERILTSHDVTWSRRDSFCKDQYLAEQPEELPTMPVRTTIFQVDPPKSKSGFEKFAFGEGIWDE